MRYLIYMILVAITPVPSIASFEVQCCEPNFSTRKFDGIHYCYNGTTKIKKTFGLSCELISSSNLDLYNHSVTDAGDLIDIDDKDFGPYQNGSYCFGKKVGRTSVQRHVWTCEVPVVVLIEYTTKAYITVVSSVFYFLTAITYMILPELRDLNGLSIVSTCTCLGIGHSIFAAMQLISYTNMQLCAVRGFMAYFFLIASFFWLNALTIQIAKNGTRPVVYSARWRSYMWYSLYVWGCTSALTLCVIVVNYIEGDHKRPGIGLNTCWFTNTTQLWYYFYSIMTVLSAANIFLFLYTSMHMWRNTFGSSNAKALKYKFLLTLKLFFLTGIPWMFEMIHALFADNLFFAITDVIILLMGVWIFAVLVIFRRKAIKGLHSRGYFCCLSNYLNRYLAKADDDEDAGFQTTVMPQEMQSAI